MGDSSYSELIPRELFPLPPSPEAQERNEAIVKKKQEKTKKILADAFGGTTKVVKSNPNP